MSRCRAGGLLSCANREGPVWKGQSDEEGADTAKDGKVGLVAVRTVRSSAGSTHNPSMLGKIRSGFLCSIITEQVQGDVLESEV